MAVQVLPSVCGVWMISFQFATAGLYCDLHVSTYHIQVHFTADVHGIQADPFAGKRRKSHVELHTTRDMTAAVVVGKV